MARITEQYIETRISQLKEKIKQANIVVGFDDNYAEIISQQFVTLCNSPEVKSRDSNPIHTLTRIKRIARNAIRIAIQSNPKRKAQVAFWQNEYSEKCQEMKKIDPAASFFSFETAYAKKLKIEFSHFKTLFLISPKKDVEEARKKA